ncbi:unnamed protein product [Amoebophrya sp. A120]|nr:unnamed protein product [Amoebophrya sp. A120]|eukprot:GSA120T00016700001.1
MLWRGSKSTERRPSSCTCCYRHFIFNNTALNMFSVLFCQYLLRACWNTPTSGTAFAIMRKEKVKGFDESRLAQDEDVADNYGGRNMRGLTQRAQRISRRSHGTSRTGQIKASRLETDGGIDIDISPLAVEERRRLYVRGSLADAADARNAWPDLTKSNSLGGGPTEATTTVLDSSGGEDAPVRLSVASYMQRQLAFGFATLHRKMTTLRRNFSSLLEGQDTDTQFTSEDVEGDKQNVREGWVCFQKLLYLLGCALLPICVLACCACVIVFRKRCNLKRIQARWDARAAQEHGHLVPMEVPSNFYTYDGRSKSAQSKSVTSGSAPGAGLQKQQQSRSLRDLVGGSARAPVTTNYNKGGGLLADGLPPSGQVDALRRAGPSRQQGMLSPQGRRSASDHDGTGQSYPYPVGVVGAGPGHGIASGSGLTSADGLQLQSGADEAESWSRVNTENEQAAADHVDFSHGNNKNAPASASMQSGMMSNANAGASGMLSSIMQSHTDENDKYDTLLQEQHANAESDGTDGDQDAGAFFGSPGMASSGPHGGHHSGLGSGLQSYTDGNMGTGTNDLLRADDSDRHTIDFGSTEEIGAKGGVERVENFAAANKPKKKKRKSSTLQSKDRGTETDEPFSSGLHNYNGTDDKNIALLAEAEEEKLRQIGLGSVEVIGKKGGVQALQNFGTAAVATKTAEVKSYDELGLHDSIENHEDVKLLRDVGQVETVLVDTGFTKGYARKAAAAMLKNPAEQGLPSEGLTDQDRKAMDAVGLEPHDGLSALQSVVEESLLSSAPPAPVSIEVRADNHDHFYGAIEDGSTETAQLNSGFKPMAAMKKSAKTKRKKEAAT